MVLSRQISSQVKVAWSNRLTNHVSGTAIGAKELRLVMESTSQANEQISASLNASYVISGSGLETCGEFLNRQSLEAFLVDLKLIAGVSRKETLFKR